MPDSLLAIPVAISLILLLGDSLRRRGLFTTFVLFVLGFLFFSVKENLAARSLLAQHLYDMTGRSFLLIGRVPLGVILGQLFLINVTWSLSERILSQNERTKNQAFQTMLLMMAITGTIAYAMEITGTQAGWWKWRNPVTSFSPLIPPMPIVIGWGIYVFGMMAPYLLLSCSSRTRMLLAILFFQFLFFFIYYKDRFARLFGVVMAALVFVGSFKDKRLSSMIISPPDKVWQNLKGPLAWLFDHSLEISALLNLGVIAFVLLQQIDKPIPTYPFLGMACFYLMGITRVRLEPIVVFIVILGFCGLLDPSAQMAFSLICLYLGFCFVLAPIARNIWRISYMFAFSFSIVFTVPIAGLLKLVDIHLALRIDSLIFSCLLFWFIIQEVLEKRRTEPCRN